ncbi:MAG TPA: FAD-binding oxidoreductase, partial [Chlamydiales bacterium]|nr:FAD-binding oxidoreductase [Chlamydiales bacterium]
MEWIEELKRQLHSEVRTDAVSQAIYSTDASIFEVTPQAICIPRTKKELLQACQIAAHYKIPLTARGAATGITGSCLGTGLIIDLSKYLTNIFDIDLHRAKIRCEPGLVQDDLNTALAPFGYRLGPDTSTGNRATIGGMVGNNAAGAHALKFGRMVDHVEEVELILANGTVIHCKALTPDEWKQKCAQ